MSSLLSSKKFQLGFTLIELLIVVAIIVILVAVGAVSYSTVSRNNRNADRIADLAKMRQALEEYYADHRTYPNTGGSNVVNQYWEGGAIGTGSDGAMQGAGRSCNTTDNTDEAMCCLFGGTTASNHSPGDLVSKCKEPFNTYLNQADPHNRTDPFYNGPTVGHALNEIYLYASDGQTYVLVTRLYEGTPSEPARRFTRQNEPFYYCEFRDENPLTVWDTQYYVRSDTVREPTTQEKAAKPGWATCS